MVKPKILGFTRNCTMDVYTIFLFGLVFNFRVCRPVYSICQVKKIGLPNEKCQYGLEDVNGLGTGH